MTTKHACLTPFNKDAVIIVDSENRPCVISKSKYKSDGTWSGSCVVLHEHNHDAFYVAIYNYTEEQIKSVGTSLSMQEVYEIRNTVRSFKADK